MSDGLVNLEQIIQSCAQIVEGLERTGNESLEQELQALKGMGERLEGLKEKFFIKTTAAVPATRVCLKSTEKALEELGNDGAQTLKKALEELIEGIEALEEKADMGGITLT